MNNTEHSSNLASLQFEKKKDIHNLSAAAVEFLLGSLAKVGFVETQKMIDLKLQFAAETNERELHRLTSQYLDHVLEITDTDKTLMAAVAVHIFLVTFYFSMQNEQVEQLYEDAVHEALEAITDAEGFVNAEHEQVLAQLYLKLSSLINWFNLEKK